MDRLKAIEVVKSHYPTNKQMLNEALETLFPELNENEDEKIRKAIVAFFECQDDNTTYSFVPKQSILAWLEKQGEKKEKSTDVELRFKVGDWVVNRYGYVWHVDSFDKKNCQVSNGEGDDCYFKISKQDEFHLWTIEDAKDGDVLQLGNVTAIFKKYIGDEQCICYCAYCKGERFEIPIADGDDNNYGCHNAHPATKEQRGLLFRKMKEAGYEWDYIDKKVLKID